MRINLFEFLFIIAYFTLILLDILISIPLSLYSTDVIDLSLNFPKYFLNQIHCAFSFSFLCLL